MAADPLSLRAYLALTWLAPPLAKVLLRRRLARGKEDPNRMSEKLGKPSAQRPDGPLIWINAVGLGEVLSLRGLIASLTSQNPNAHVLVTSTTRDSSQVLGANLPARTLHQYLPIDAPQFRKTFLDHWRPAIAIWAEQDIWPGFVTEISKRRIPQAIVASRMDDKSLKSRQKAPAMARAIFERMAMITAQDDRTANNLRELGAVDIVVSGSLKPAAPPLSADEAELSELSNLLQERFVWSVVSAYPEDERIALEAHSILRKSNPTALLIVVPRQVNRNFAHLGQAPRRSLSQQPGTVDNVWLADTIGEVGLVLGLSQAALIGGTFSDIEGHNPWEAATLGVASFHGPRSANFKSDFQALDNAGASYAIETAEQLAEHLMSNDFSKMARNGFLLSQAHKTSVDKLAGQLLELIND